MSDDYDDILDGDRQRVEDRFRELEVEAEIDRMRRQQGGAPRRERPAAATGASGADDLADMKAALDGDGPAGDAEENDHADAERYVLAICPHCDAKNRVSLTKLRTGDPKCGACKKPLSFTR